MKTSLALSAALLALTLGLTALDSDARRFGGGSSLGKQRPAPAMKEAPKQAPAGAPAQQAAPASAATPAAPAAAPAAQGFMGRWGGMIAGLGIGALLATLFAGPLGGLGGLLLLMLAAGLAFMAYRAYASRSSPLASAPAQFAGAGRNGAARPPLNIGAGVPAAAVAPPSAAVAIPGFEAAPFLRVARTSFIRLQAANDARDLDDIRDFTTPEMYAEISMQVRERGEAPQKTEVVTLDASLVEAVVEGDHEIASVRFTGLIRESEEGNPEPFDEVWHVRKRRNDRKATWLIAGIQQVS